MLEGNHFLCSDNLAGIKEAITAAFPMTEQQRCIVHMVRNTLKYVPNKDMTAFYTTNAIELLNSSLRRLNRQRSVFPSSQALLKALYLATFEATQKWTMPIRNWNQVRGELKIMYPDRLPE